MWNEVSENEAKEIFHPDLKVLNLKESRKEDDNKKKREMKRNEEA